MEKKTGKNKIVVIVCGLVLFLISVCSSFCFFYFNYKCYKLSMIYDKKLEELSIKKNRQISLDSEISVYSNIDKEIEDLKNEFFKTAMELETDIRNGKSDKKIAYLTFDDGPYYNTYQVFAILDNYNVGATFFTTNANGNNCYDNKEFDCYKLYPEYIKHGHTIANHTYTHSIFKGLYTSTDTFMDAVVRQHEHVKEQTGGYLMNIVRFPGGSDTANHFKVKEDIINKLRERGYGWVDWNSLDGDGGYLPNRDKAWSTFTGSINEDIEVVLFHDYSGITTSMLPDAIEYLEGNGYVLLPLFYESVMINK